MPNHLRLQDARAGQPHAETHAIPRGRAAAAGWRGSGTVAPTVAGRAAFVLRFVVFFDVVVDVPAGAVHRRLWTSL